MTKPFGGTTKEGQRSYELSINQMVTIVITIKLNKKHFLKFNSISFHKNIQ